MKQLEERTMKKVFRRLVPFLMLCYFFNFLDRVNVSFAALDMNKDLGFSASVFGFGSGILFLSYMLCETPSNAFLGSALLGMGRNVLITRATACRACPPAGK